MMKSAPRIPFSNEVIIVCEDYRMELAINSIFRDPTSVIIRGFSPKNRSRIVVEKMNTFLKDGCSFHAYGKHELRVFHDMAKQKLIENNMFIVLDRDYDVRYEERILYLDYYAAENLYLCNLPYFAPNEKYQIWIEKINKLYLNEYEKKIL